MAGVAEHLEQALQEAHRAEVVEFAPDSGAALGGSGDVRLAAEPGRERVRGRGVPGQGRGPVGAQRLGEAGVCTETAASRFSRSRSTASLTASSPRSASCGSAAIASDWSVNSQESRTGRNALGGNDAVRSDSPIRR